MSQSDRYRIRRMLYWHRIAPIFSREGVLTLRPFCRSLRVLVALMVMLTWLAVLAAGPKHVSGAPIVSDALTIDLRDPTRQERKQQRDQRQLEAQERAALRRDQEEWRQDLAASLAHRNATSWATARRTVADRKIANLVPVHYRDLVLDVAEQFGLDPRILAAVGSVESQWYARALGTHGDSGLMQILPGTAEWIAGKLGWERYDIYDPQTNMTMGAWYLYVLHKQYGDWGQALAAYNGGPRAAPRGATHPYTRLVMRVYQQGL